MRISSIVSILITASAACGCAVVVSERQSLAPGGAGATVPAGVPYMLPKALLPVEVVANGASIRIDALEPVFVGDPDESYILRYNGSAFAKDVVTIEVDPKTSLLKRLVVERKDETGEILKKLIASSIRAESATGAGDIVIYQAIIDPDEPASARAFARGADTAIAAYLLGGGNCTADDCRAAAKALHGEVTRADTATAEASVRLLGTAPALATKRVDLGRPVLVAAQTPLPAADCSVGICQRASLPYVVELRLLEIVRQTVLLLPNRGQVIPLALDGKPFVTVKHTVALRNGVVEMYDVDKPSSALALVSWPLDVYDAIVTTTAKILQLKIDTSRNSTALQEQLVADAEKRKALENRLEKLRPESAALVDIGSNGRILSVGKGQASGVLPPGARKAAGRAAEPQASTAAAAPLPDTATKVLPGSSGTAASAAGR